MSRVIIYIFISVFLFNLLNCAHVNCSLYKMSIATFLSQMFPLKIHQNLLSDKFYVLVNKIECVDHNDELCSNLNCTIKPVGRYKSLLTIGCNLSTVVNPLMIKYQLNYKYSGYRPYLVDFNENMCNIMDNAVSALAFRQVAGALSNYSNMFHPCPYKGFLYLRDFPITSDISHPAMPVGDYRSDIRFYNKKNQTLLFAKIYLTFKPRGTRYQTNG